MDGNNGHRTLRSISYYIPRALKFYDLKNEHLTRIVFIVTLFSLFIVTYNQLVSLMSIMHKKTPEGGDSFTSLIVSVLIYLSSGIYLISAIKELKGKEYTAGDCIRKISRKAFRIIIATLGYTIITNFGLVFLLFVPGVIFGIMFLFYLCYILDLGIGITESFGASRRLTKGYRLQMFFIQLVFYLILLLPALIVLTMVWLLNNLLAVSFVVAFILSVISLMQQKLIALMYVDLEYGYIEKNKEENSEING